MRYFFEIAYHGKHYAGWQSQRNALGVQAVVEDGLSKIIGKKISIVGSGRTDSGVHCQQQFFHADMPSLKDEGVFLYKLNSILPKDIAIKSIKPVKEEAHARYSAIERIYQYQVAKVKDPFQDGLALFYFKPLDCKTMNQASSLLLGVHDFQCFSKVKTDVNHFYCDVRQALWKEKGNGIVFTIVANRFLRGMVRAIVGTLLEVGAGKLTVNEFKQIIKSKDRSKAGANVSPAGLYLTKVRYPASIFIKPK